MAWLLGGQAKAKAKRPGDGQVSLRDALRARGGARNAGAMAATDIEDNKDFKSDLKLDWLNLQAFAPKNLQQVVEKIRTSDLAKIVTERLPERGTGESDTDGYLSDLAEKATRGAKKAKGIGQSLKAASAPSKSSNPQTANLRAMLQARGGVQIAQQTVVDEAAMQYIWGEASAAAAATTTAGSEEAEAAQASEEEAEALASSLDSIREDSAQPSADEAESAQDSAEMVSAEEAGSAEVETDKDDDDALPAQAHQDDHGADSVSTELEDAVADDLRPDLGALPRLSEADEEDEEEEKATERQEERPQDEEEDREEAEEQVQEDPAAKEEAAQPSEEGDARDDEKAFEDVPLEQEEAQEAEVEEPAVSEEREQEQAEQVEQEEEDEEEEKEEEEEAAAPAPVAAAEKLAAAAEEQPAAATATERSSGDPEPEQADPEPEQAEAAAAPKVVARQPEAAPPTTIRTGWQAPNRVQAVTASATGGYVAAEGEAAKRQSLAPEPPAMKSREPRQSVTASATGYVAAEGEAARKQKLASEPPAMKPTVKKASPSKGTVMDLAQMWGGSGKKAVGFAGPPLMGSGANGARRGLSRGEAQATLQRLQAVGGDFDEVRRLRKLIAELE